MDSFYYNLLNIGKKSMSEDEYLNKIDISIEDIMLERTKK